MAEMSPEKSNGSTSKSPANLREKKGIPASLQINRSFSTPNDQEDESVGEKKTFEWHSDVSPLVTTERDDERPKFLTRDGRVVVGHYSGNERLDPSQFEEPDADAGDFMKSMWFDDVWNDEEFHSEMAEMVERYERALAITCDPSDVVVHCVGQSHIDVAWKWRYEQTRKKAAVTFRKAVYHAKTFPGTFCFALSEPLLLEWVKEDDPELFEEVREAVRAGGIELVGGSYVEPDCVMPSGEAMARSRLYGQRFYRDHFGQLAETEWFLDSFGYNAGLPQVLVKSGAKYFWTSKITWNRQTVFPFVDFWWQGLDGSRILTCNFPMGYGPLDKWMLYEMGRHPVKEGADPVWNYERDYTGDDLEDSLDLEATVPHMGCFFGKGDGGHGPTHQEVVQVNGLVKQGRLFRWSRVKRFFEGVAEWGDRLPVWADELYLEYHRGTFSVHWNVKRHNRLLENLLCATEPLATSVAVASGNLGAYPSAELERAWKTLLKNQFHDVLPGSSIPEVYDDVCEDWAESKRTLAEVAERAAARLKAPAGAHLLLYNPLSWERTDRAFVPVDSVARATGTEVPLDGKGKPPAGQLELLTDGNGAASAWVRVPLQPVAAEPDWWPEGRPAGWWCVVKLAPLSVTAARVILSGEAEPVPGGGGPIASVAPDRPGSPAVLESGELEVEISRSTGAITKMASSRVPGVANLLQGESSGLVEAFVDDYPHDHAWNLKPEYWKFPVALDHDDGVEVSVLDSGPVFATLQVRRRLGPDRAVVVQRYSMFRGRPELYCEFACQDWPTPHVMLKLVYETSTGADRCTADAQFGAIERSTKPETPADRARYEKTCRAYYDVSTPDLSWGLATLNEGKYAFDATGGRTRLTLLRTPTYPTAAAEAWVNVERRVRMERHGTRPPEVVDLGPFACRHALLPHAGGALRNPDGSPNPAVKRAAEEFNVPVVVFVAGGAAAGGGAGGAPLADGEPLVRVDAPNVVVSALKLEEWTGDGSLALRLLEVCGADSTDVEVAFHPALASRVASVRPADLLERPLEGELGGPLPLRDGSFRCRLGKFEAATFKVEVRRKAD
ncbi:MAG: alpha-mannosidase [Promethearchaeota archaeon]